MYQATSPPDPAVVEIVAGLPVEPGRIPVLVAPPVHPTDPAVIAVLDRLLRASSPLGGVSGGHRGTVLRLVVPWTGRARQCAAALSSRLGLEVVAPSEALWVVPDGSLFVAAPSGGVWRRFRPAAPPVDEGARFPAPGWQHALAGFLADARTPGTNDTDVTVTEIPSGVWLRPHDAPPVRQEDLAVAAPAGSDMVTVLVGVAGGTRVSLTAVARFLGALPRSLRDAAVLVDHDRTAGEGSLGAACADLTGHAVRVSPGLALLDAEGRPRVTVIAGDEPGWYPYTQLLEFRPGTTDPVVLSSTPPLPVWAPTTTHTWPLVRGWVVEAVQAGLWIRPEHLPVPQRATGPAGSDQRVAARPTVRSISPDPLGPLLVVGDGSRPEHSPPGGTVTHLLRRIAAATPHPPRVVTVDAAMDPGRPT